MRQHLALLVVSLVCCPPAVEGQGSRLSIAADVAAEGGSGRGGEYDYRGQLSGRLSGLALFALRERLDGTIGLDFDKFVHPGDRLDICRIGSRGQCVPGFPSLAGWSATAGVRFRPDRRFHIGARVGGGRYRVPANGDRPSEHTVALVLREEIAWRMAGPLWLLGTGSIVRASSVAGEPLRVVSFGVGVRVH